MTACNYGFFGLLGALLCGASATSFAQEAAPFPAASGVELHRASRAVVLDTDGSSEDRAGRTLSDGLSPVAILGGAVLLFDNHNHHGEARRGLEGMALTGLTTVFLKKAINEKRPVEGGGSFPSGHASLAFSLATALTEDHPRYKLLAFGAASAIAWARVEVQAHYWHDVVAGAALGYFTTKHFMHHHLTVLPEGIGVQKMF